jgi:hypothetical protein
MTELALTNQKKFLKQTNEQKKNKKKNKKTNKKNKIKQRKSYFFVFFVVSI